MSFYVTLPSSSPQNEFPNNTLTHYITRLKNPSRLSGNYEVGQAQISEKLAFSTKCFDISWIADGIY
jgi:hypothetical protein